MSNNEIVRSWKDESAESPAGSVDLDALSGGLAAATWGGTCEILSFGCCWDPK